jgi:hypothetical protein
MITLIFFTHKIVVMESYGISESFYSSYERMNCDFAAGYIKGGYSVLTQTTSLKFNLQDRHDSVQLSFDLFFLDFWRGEEIQLRIKGGEILKSFKPNVSNCFVDFCGETAYDSLERVTLEFAHTNMILDLELTVAETSRNQNIFSEKKSWLIGHFILEMKAFCQSNARTNLEKPNEPHRCICQDGYFAKKVNCSKSSYYGSFCFECQKCPLTCEKCVPQILIDGSTVPACMECSLSYSLVNSNCSSNNSNLIKKIKRI